MRGGLMCTAAAVAPLCTLGCFGGGCPSAVQLVEGRNRLAWLPCMRAAMHVAGHNACL